MGSIPANLTRVPSALSSQLLLGGLTRTNGSLVELQQQLSTFKRVNTPSDDPIAASLISVVEADLETGAQRTRNLSHATSVLNTIDSRLGELSNLALEARSIASSQVGVGSDTATRAQQAQVISSSITQLFSTINSDFAGLSLFAGARTGGPAVESFYGGYRYVGDRDGLRTDLGDAADFPITIPADLAVGSLSARVEGDVDLDPALTADTRLSDLRGPMANIAELGSIAITVTVGGTPTELTADLSAAETVGDVAEIIEAEILTNGPAGAAGTTVGFGADRLQIASPGPTVTIEFADGPAGASARALGIDNFTYTDVATVNAIPATDLDPAVTDRTTLGSLGAPAVFGDITFTNGGRSGTITTDGTWTIARLREEVRRLDLGVRVEVNEAGDGINVVNEVAGARLSIEENGSTAASSLGIRSLDVTTPLSVFNDGRGVEIAHGAGDPDLDNDFEVTLSDGTTFVVDLTPADAQNVQTVIDAINAAAVGAGIAPADFQATLTTAGNGIALTDNLGGGTPISVQSLNGFAAEDLGLLDGEFTPGTPNVLLGEDRATVRVDSLFTSLIDLRDALDRDDQRGITFAGERLEADIDRLATARGLVGARAAESEQLTRRLEDRTLLNEQLKSQVQDLDVFAATSRLTLLQTQLQASLTAAAQTRPLSLLNFL